MQKIIDRLKREPILSRAGLAAILNVLVVAGVLNTEASTELETAIVAVVSVFALIAARARTVPVVPASFKRTSKTRV